MHRSAVSRMVLGGGVFMAVPLAVVAAQRTYALVASRDHAAIQYSTGPVSNRVAELNKKIQDGAIRLTLEGPGGYLRPALRALDVPVFFFQAEDGIRDHCVTGVQTCALPI